VLLDRVDEDGCHVDTARCVERWRFQFRVTPVPACVNPAHHRPRSGPWRRQTSRRTSRPHRPFDFFDGEVVGDPPLLAVPALDVGAESIGQILDIRRPLERVVVSRQHAVLRHREVRLDEVGLCAIARS
jgi:hypothetical protein